MLISKFLNVHKLVYSRVRPKPEAQSQPQPQQEAEEEGRPKTSSALKIVHAGGVVECYYMAIPAAVIMKKYPAFVLARPQVFRRPRDSLVGWDEMLTPGEKFYVVPRRTVRKLIRRRAKKPNIDVHYSSIDVSKDNGLSSKSFLQGKQAMMNVMMMSDEQSSEVSGSFMSSLKKKNNVVGTKKKKQVRFAGIDGKKSKDEEQGIASANAKTSNNQRQGLRRKPKYGALWQPSLTAINERGLVD